MNLEIRYTPEFVRTYSKLERDLQLEIKSKIELFKNTKDGLWKDGQIRNFSREEGVFSLIAKAFSKILSK